MGARQKLLAPGAEEIEHRLRRRQQDLVLAGEREPLPDHGKAIDVEGGQSPFVEFGGDRVRGNKRNAETRDHGLLDGLVAAHGEADLGANAGGLEQLLHQAARSGSGLARQEGFAGEFAQRDAGFSRQPMCGRRDDDMGMIADQVNVHVDVGRRAAHDREVEIVAAQRLADLLPVADRERDFDVRMSFENPEIMNGTKYFAVLTAPIEMRPAVLPPSSPTWSRSR